MIFVGPNSPNPDRSVFSQDKNNFGPAVGFAWQMPWLGKGKTTIRGGYQISYVEPDNATTIEGIIGNPPGSTSNAAYTPTTYLNLANMASVIPATASAKPMTPVPLTDRSHPEFDAVGDSEYRIEADGRCPIYRHFAEEHNFKINTPNFLTNGLFEAFNAARYGDDTNPATPLLDRLFAPLRGTKSGAAYLRNPTRGYTPGEKHARQWKLLRSRPVISNCRILARCRNYESWLFAQDCRTPRELHCYQSSVRHREPSYQLGHG